MGSKRITWRITALITAAIGAILATGLFAGRFLESYDATIWFELEAERIATVLDVAPGDAVGDIRAGTGRWSVDLARRVGPEGEIFATTGRHRHTCCLKRSAPRRSRTCRSSLARQAKAGASRPVAATVSCSATSTVALAIGHGLGPRCRAT